MMHDDATMIIRTSDGTEYAFGREPGETAPEWEHRALATVERSVRRPAAIPMPCLCVSWG